LFVQLVVGYKGDAHLLFFSIPLFIKKL